MRSRTSSRCIALFVAVLSLGAGGALHAQDEVGPGALEHGRLDASRQHIPDYYVDSVTGSDANTGMSPDDPLRSLRRLSELYGRLDDGPSIVNIAGDHLGGHSFNGTKATFQQWQGHAPARFRGSRDPTEGGHKWELSAGTTYRCMIGAGQRVGNVCARWGTLLRALGRTAGWYRVDELSGGALAADKRYFYDDSEGYLYFRDDSIGDPNALVGDDRVFWQDWNIPIGLDVRDWPRHGEPVTVRGITFMHFNAGRGVSYGLMAGGTDHTVIDCTFYDCESHAIVFTNYPNTNSRAIRCIAYGAGAGVIGRRDNPSLYVSHTGRETPDARVTGTRFIECAAYCYGLQDPDGAPIDPVDNIHGFYGHTSGTPGSTVDDYEWDRCVVYHISNRGFSYYCGDTAGVSDPHSWNSYPVRARDCVVVGGGGIETTGNIAYQGCFFDLTGGTTHSGLGTGLINLNDRHSNLFESCVIVADTDTSDPNIGVRAVYRLETASRLIRVNCTTIDLGSRDDQHHAIVYAQDHSAGFVPGASGFRAESYGCLDVFADYNPTNHYFVNDGPLNPLSGPEACYVSEGCWSFGVSPGAYSNNPEISTGELFRTRLDPNAVIGIDPVFVDAMSVDAGVAATVAQQSPVRTNTFVPTLHAEVGYNGVPFSGHRGAIQFGEEPCQCDFFPDGRLDSQDFFVFLGAFFAGDADSNSDGVTNTQDFFDFLACFFTPPGPCK